MGAALTVVALTVADTRPRAMAADILLLAADHTEVGPHMEADHPTVVARLTAVAPMVVAGTDGR